MVRATRSSRGSTYVHVRHCISLLITAASNKSCGEGGKKSSHPHPQSLQASHSTTALWEKVLLLRGSSVTTFDDFTSTASNNTFTSSLSMLSHSSCKEVSCPTDTPLFLPWWWGVEEWRVGTEVTPLLARLAGCRDQIEMFKNSICLASFQSSMRLGNEAKVKQCLLFLLYSPRKILHKPYRRGSYNVIHESLCSTWCWLLRLPHIELLGKRNYVILKTRCVQMSPV